MKTKKIITCLLALSLVATCFAGCSFNSKDPWDNTKYEIENGELIIKGYTDRTDITEFNIGDEYEVDGKSYPVTKIADFGLCNAESLTKITIGKNVKEIGPWSMTNNQHLVEFDVDDENPYFCDIDGVIYTKDMKTVVYYPPAKFIGFDKYGQVNKIDGVEVEYNEKEGKYFKKDTETEVKFPEYKIADGVETIRENSFYKCYYVNVKAPSTVKEIQEKAFFKTSELEDFVMPASIVKIGKDAFAYDDKLKTIEIGKNIKQIDEYAFFNCTGMEKITVAKKEKDIKLGNKWQPTAKGRIRDDCTVTFK